ncbi:MAG: hypothetical protein NTZ55_05645 [Candidatus Roizmanbacteria bacterium]|nr:hypothetical protein [Candidatus Roizmanbacteria bacterium]
MKNNNQIDASLILFALAFFVLIFGLSSKFMFHNNAPILKKEQTPNTISSSSQNNTKVSKKLNYNLPILCDYKTRESSTSAITNMESISVSVLSNTSSRTYLVQGDCLYVWNKTELIGKKKCGVGNYIKLGKQLLSSDIISIDSVINMFPQTQGISSGELQNIFASCKNIKEVNKEAFTIPKNITFELEK